MSTEMNKEEFGVKYFDVTMSTLSFVGFSILTMGSWFTYWLIHLVKSINKIRNREIISIYLVIATFAAIPISLILAVISPIIPLIGFLTMIALSIYLSIISKKEIELLLAENNIPFKLNTFLCVIFPMYYQYYIVRNAEEIYQKSSTQAHFESQAKMPAPPQDDKYAKIEKLAKLRDSGALTEEEFLEQKKNILGKDN